MSTMSKEQLKHAATQEVKAIEKLKELPTTSKGKPSIPEHLTPKLGDKHRHSGW